MVGVIVGVAEAEGEGGGGEGTGAVHLHEEGGVGVFHAHYAVGELGSEESGDGGLASEVEAEGGVWGFSGGAFLNIFSNSVKFLLGFIVGLVWWVGLVSIVGSGFLVFIGFGFLFLDEVAKPLCFTNVISFTIFKNIFWFLWG